MQLFQNHDWGIRVNSQTFWGCLREGHIVILYIYICYILFVMFYQEESFKHLFLLNLFIFKGCHLKIQGQEMHWNEEALVLHIERKFLSHGVDWFSIVKLGALVCWKRDIITWQKPGHSTHFEEHKLHQCFIRLIKVYLGWPSPCSCWLFLETEHMDFECLWLFPDVMIRADSCQVAPRTNCWMLVTGICIPHHYRPIWSKGCL